MLTLHDNNWLFRGNGSWTCAPSATSESAVSAPSAVCPAAAPCTASASAATAAAVAALTDSVASAESRSSASTSSRHAAVHKNPLPLRIPGFHYGDDNKRGEMHTRGFVAVW